MLMCGGVVSSVFIFGFIPYSSGKTVVACAVARGVANQGYTVAGFKPRSGHSFWYQYEVFAEGVERGQLFCTDIVKLRQASRCQLPFEVLNPVDALMSPVKVGRFVEQEQFHRLYRIQQESFAQLVMERYTVVQKDGLERRLCVNEANMQSGLNLCDRQCVEPLMSGADVIIPVQSVSEWNEVFQTVGPVAIQSCYREIAGKHEVVVVEAFNDAVCPDPSLRYDLVIGTAPGVAIIYDAEEFHRRLETLVELGKDPTTLRAEDIVQYLKKDQLVHIPPLRQDLIADYEQLSQNLEELVTVTMRELSQR